MNHSEECQDTAELYDRHFWNDDTFNCLVVSNRHDEDIKYKEPERIEKMKICKQGDEYLVDKINELIEISNKYARLLEKVESDV